MQILIARHQGRGRPLAVNPRYKYLFLFFLKKIQPIPEKYSGGGSKWFPRHSKVSILSTRLELISYSSHHVHVSCQETNYTISKPNIPKPIPSTVKPDVF